MEYFSDPAFPENLFQVWDAQFVWLERTTRRAAIMGEYGGSLEDNDRAVQQTLVKVHACVQMLLAMSTCLHAVNATFLLT